MSSSSASSTLTRSVRRPIASVIRISSPSVLVRAPIVSTRSPCTIARPENTERTTTSVRSTCSTWIG